MKIQVHVAQGYNGCVANTAAGAQRELPREELAEILRNPLCTCHPSRSCGAPKPDEFRDFIQVVSQSTFENRLVVSDAISKQADMFKVIVNPLPQMSN